MSLMRAMVTLALVAIVSSSAAALTMASPAGAITGDFVTDNEHPYVGLIAFYDADGEFTHRCSGSLPRSSPRRGIGVIATAR